VITVLVGHRGTGKTSLLRRIPSYCPDALTLDLDRVIEETLGITIDAIFATRGEHAFRDLEREHLARLVQRADLAAPDRPVFLALGAGFEGPIPEGVHCLWVRRDTDRLGRIFLDRPRLEPAAEPLDEYGRRFPEREARYRAWSDDVLTLGEGFEEPEPGEAAFFTGTPGAHPALLTLLPAHLPHARSSRERLRAWADRRRKLGITTFELRDDLLSPGQIHTAFEVLPPDELLYSFRKPDPSRPEPWPNGLTLDWDVTLGRCPYGAPPIASLHARTNHDTLPETIRKLEAAAPDAGHYKLAVEVHSFEELAAGHGWASPDPAHRSFLPCSPDGRWSWYRRLHGARYRLAFVREAAGSAPDQPTVAEWLRQGASIQPFAAVLGDPASHSRTPAEHFAFFAGRDVPVVAVRVSEADWEQGALQFLEALGLRYAAVTAPLKHHAFQSAGRVTALAREFRSVNTLYRDEALGEWRGTNTDHEGFERAWRELDLTGPVAVWGGGGTLAMMNRVLPDASYFEARTGALRHGPRIRKPRVVVFATGRPGADPPASWQPGCVLDLDYRDHAPGRAYALRVNARYVSGLAMFRHQAAAQRAWWERKKA
jgi:shikimate dehydrogenase-like protein/shikimate kinase